MPRKNVSADDDDDEYTEGQSTQAKKLQASPEMIERKVGELAQYFLIMEQNKVPVKRADISRNVLKEYKALFPAVLQRAKNLLSEVFGFQLVEVEHPTGKSRTKVYFLLNKLSSELREELVEIPAERPKNGLLWIILAVIFMNESVITEAQLWEALQKLGLSQEEKAHPAFGDVRKLITTEFTRQLYLEYTRVPNTDPALYELRWGARAKAEVDKERLLEMVTEIYGNNMTPQSWRTQYREVQEWKKKRGRDMEVDG